MTLEELESAYDREVRTNKRAAAETAYALAVRYRGEDVAGERRFDLAKVWAWRALELLDSLPSDSLEQVSSISSLVGGVPVPEFLHSGVVRERLSDILV
jgi:hypothetical protein